MGRRERGRDKGHLILARWRLSPHIRGMETLPAIAAPDRTAEIRALARRYRRANGPVMAIVNRIGGAVEDRMAMLPEGARAQIGAVVESQPFGGEGLSGTGPKAGGPHYLPRFATERVTCIDTTAAGGNASLPAAGHSTNVSASGPR